MTSSKMIKTKKVPSCPMDSLKKNKEPLECPSRGESDIESDAGASPSFSESESVSISSRPTSPEEGDLQIDWNPNKKKSSKLPKPQQNKSSKSTTPNNSNCSPVISTSGNSRKRRKRSDAEQRRQSRQSNNPTTSTVSPATVKRKLLNQRRRTKSERNIRASKGQEIEEEDVALGAEIDKLLEDKATATNLSTKNVKSIILHVMTNNMVQKMLMSQLKKKGGSSDEEPLFEHKVTRSKTKSLLENQTSSLWPLASPAKAKAPADVSETIVLINQELPEDSSGDEEYVPKEDEIYSDDESSSIASVEPVSDNGSPRVPSTPVSCVSVSSPNSGITKRYIGGASNLITPSKPEICFKTPPPIKPKCARRLQMKDNTIGQRTRSKQPLTDTPLEDLEMQLIPPDITADMYDWGISDNEDYLGFLNDFLRPGQSMGVETAETGDEDDADYNCMEDYEEEELHDKEEMRMDRAVKVTKKELNELVAELLEENHFTSGDEFNESEFTSYCTSQLSHISLANGVVDSSGNAVKANENLVESSIISLEHKENLPSRSVRRMSSKNCPPLLAPHSLSKPIMSTIDDCTLEEPDISTQKFYLQKISLSMTPTSDEGYVSVPEIREEPLFNQVRLEILEHQLRQHVQLLAQSYALTVTREESHVNNIAKASKRMIIEVRNLGIVNGESSVISKVTNSETAWQFVNNFPVVASAGSPIKKKILAEHVNETAVYDEQGFGGNYIPRPVVKAIAESEAFIYPELLPTNYDQNTHSKLPFLPSEDVLLIYGLDDLKDDNKLSWKEKSKLIAEWILPPRSTDAIWNRIRNLRKTKHAHSSKAATVTSDYFQHGILPKGRERPPAWDPADAIAPMHQPKENLSVIWLTWISSLPINPEATKYPGTSRKPGRRKRKSEKSEAKILCTSLPDDFCIKTTFPNGITLVQQQIADNPELTAFPITNIHGDPQAYMFIPNNALPAMQQQDGDNGNGNSNKDKHSTDTKEKTQQQKQHQDVSAGSSSQDNYSSQGSQSIRGGGATGGGGNEEDDDKKKPNKSTRELPDDAADDELDKEDLDTEDDKPNVSHKRKPGKSLEVSSAEPSKGKKRRSKRSSSNSPPKKRSAKPKVPVEVMLEPDVDLYTEVCDTYMETFLSTLESTTEKRNPGLINEFKKLLAAGLPQKDLLSKVQNLLKEYPNLASEFSTFIQGGEEQVIVGEKEFSDHEELQAQLNFSRHIEKFTEKSPQLRAKISQKYKMLNDHPDLCEKDVAETLLPFFQGNPVMIRAFKALYPSIYLPGSVSEANDFEEIDMENQNEDSEEMKDVEIVRLPDENKIATVTCPCSCHETTTHVYSSRMKHCNKCCIKFQEGKVFLHNGRTVKPVNVELTSPSAARKLLNCDKTQSHSTMHQSPQTKYPNSIQKSMVVLPEEQKAPTILPETNERNSKGKRKELEDDELEEGEIPKVAKCTGVNAIENSEPLRIITPKAWSIEEDTLLLSKYGSENSPEEASIKLDSLLPHRDRTEIEGRLVELYSMLQKKLENSEEQE